MNPPYNFVINAISPTQITMLWENGDSYQYIEIWVNEAGGGYGTEPYKTIGGWKTSDQLIGLTPNTYYCIYILGGNYEPPENSDPTDEECDYTHDILTAPTDLVAIAWGDGGIELTWKYNSSTTVSGITQVIERKTGVGDFAEIATIASLREFYRDTGLNDDQEYTYRIKTVQDETPSGWSNEASATTINVTSAPATFTVVSGTLTNKTVRLTWGAVSNATGYKIEKSTDGVEYTELIVIGAGITDYLVKDLLPNTQYWFRIRAYNATGNSGYTNLTGHPITTDTIYTETEFEKAVRNPLLKPIYLVEINPKKTLTGFTLVSGKTYTYELAISDRGVDYENVFEDGDSYSEKSNIDDVEANASSFYCDYTNRKLYVRTSCQTLDLLSSGYVDCVATDIGKQVEDDGVEVGILVAYNNTTRKWIINSPSIIANASVMTITDGTGAGTADGSSVGTDPSNFLMEGSFWLYFTNSSRIVFNNKKYLSLLSSENIPGIVREIKPYFEGSYRTSDGTISLANGVIEGVAHHFDKLNAIYTWDKAKVLVKMGFGGFTYAQFVAIAGGQVVEKRCTKGHFTLKFSDVRHDFEQELVLKEFNQDNFPGLLEDREDRFVPKCYGAAHRVPAICIDLEKQQWKFHDERIKSVQEVLLDDAGLTENTDYYVDYQRGLITIDNSREVAEDTIIEVTFTGTPDSADDPINNGAEIFKHIMKNEYGLTDGELELDSLYETKEKSTDELAVFLYESEKYETIVRKLEHSLRAYTFADGDGKFGLKYFQDSAPYNVRYIKNHQIFEYEQYSNPRANYYKVNVYYQESVFTQEWQSVWAEDLDIQIKDKNSKELDIYTYLQSSYDAQQLADTILTLINHEYVTFVMSVLLYDRFPGEVIKFSQDRAFNANGTADEELMRILRAELSPSARQTTVIGEYI